MNYKTLLNNDSIYLTDGGLETTLIFHHGMNLPYFAAFDLLKDESGYKILKDYYRSYMKIAESYRYSFILETPTWRANPDWIEKMGYDESHFQAMNHLAVLLMHELKNEFHGRIKDLVISGCVGPRGDGYKPENKMTVDEATGYHSRQIKLFKVYGADIITAYTMNYQDEALGVTLAAGRYEIPVVISFTVETDGKLASGISLKDAIEYNDNNAEVKPLYYMINCAHPTHFIEQLESNDNKWIERIKGIRANASCKSHAELDESETLDAGNAEQLAKENKYIKDQYRHIRVFGGCCGTDISHISEIAKELSSRN